jgi:hypothetical protein
MRMSRVLIVTALSVIVGCANLSESGKEPAVRQSFELYPIGSAKKTRGTYHYRDRQAI